MRTSVAWICRPSTAILTSAANRGPASCCGEPVARRCLTMAPTCGRRDDRARADTAEAPTSQDKTGAEDDDRTNQRNQPTNAACQVAQRLARSSARDGE